jgi:DHA1 family tetracycline resistance protein-like MFS transporter
MLFDHVSTNITFPVLTFVFFSHLSSLFPAHTSLAERTMWYGLVIAVAHVGSIISTPIISTLSDIVGRKKMLLIASFSAFIFAVSCTAGVLLGSVALLFVGKLLGGMLSRTNSVAQAIIGDLSSDDNKAVNMGYLQVVISIGAFFGPMIGGFFAKRYFFAEINYAMPYMIAAGFALLSILLTLFIFKETLDKPQSLGESLMSWVEHLGNKRVWQISLLLIVTQLGWSTYYQYMPPLLKTNFHFHVHELGIFIGMVAFWLAIASGFGVKLLKRLFSLNTVAFISVGLMLLGALLTLLAALFASKHWAADLTWVAAIPMAMGDVIVYSVITALYSNAVGKEKQGSIMGLCFIIVPATWALTAFFGGVIATFQIDLPLYFSAGVLLILFITMCFRRVSSV